jgi:hypothetical protein
MWGKELMRMLKKTCNHDHRSLNMYQLSKKVLPTFSLGNGKVTKFCGSKKCVTPFTVSCLMEVPEQGHL